MITPKSRQTRAEVAAHYDDLDRFYREIWGEHLHHGLWESGKEAPEEAVRCLVELVAQRARLMPGARICDVGCGYGATARLLVAEYGVKATGLSVSAAQLAYARGTTEGDNPTYLLCDWLENDLPAASFDAVISIESSEHMVDKPAFFAEAHRVLRPGGRLVVCAWLARGEPHRWEIDHLLEPICREGRLPGMGTATEYERWIRDAGFEPEIHCDLSQKVKRTWSICIARALKHLARNPDYREWLLRGDSPNRVFARTLARIWVAYLLGSMRYGIFAAARPLSDLPRTSAS